jgi:hypothetical protein
MDDSYHTDIIRSKLTRNIAVTFKEVRDELVRALDDVIQAPHDGTYDPRDEDAIIQRGCRMDQDPHR